MTFTPADAFDRIAEATLNLDAGIAELYAEDAVHEWPFHFPGLPSNRLVGKDAIRTFYRKAMAGSRFEFERFTRAIVHQSVDPDTAVIEYEIEGVIRASSDPFRFSYIMVLRVRNGEIAHVRDYMDALRMTQAVNALSA